MGTELMRPHRGELVSGAWSRDDWLAYADRLLAGGARRGLSENHARITPPGAEGGYGQRRRRARGLRPHVPARRVPHRRAPRARASTTSSTSTPAASSRASTRRRPIAGCASTEHAQAKVEAASIALILDMTRPWIWDRLDALTQERVIDYFAPAVGDDTYPRTNWVWFRLVVQTFLRSVGGPWSAAGHRRRPRPPRLLRPRGRLALRRRRALVRPLRGLGAAPLPRAVVADAGRRRARERPHRQRDVAALDRFLLDAVDPRRRRRLAAHPGPQPHLPLRRRGALLGRRASPGVPSVSLGTLRAGGEPRRRALRRSRRAR